MSNSKIDLWIHYFKNSYVSDKHMCVPEKDDAYLSKKIYRETRIKNIRYRLIILIASFFLGVVISEGRGGLLALFVLFLVLMFFKSLIKTVKLVLFGLDNDDMNDYYVAFILNRLKLNDLPRRKMKRLGYIELDQIHSVTDNIRTVTLGSVFALIENSRLHLVFLDTKEMHVMYHRDSSLNEIIKYRIFANDQDLANFERTVQSHARSQAYSNAQHGYDQAVNNYRAGRGGFSGMASGIGGTVNNHLHRTNEARANTQIERIEMMIKKVYLEFDDGESFIFGSLEPYALELQNALQ